MNYDDDVFEAYKAFIFNCVIDNGFPHDADPSVNVQVDRFSLNDGIYHTVEVKIHVFTGDMHYCLRTNGEFRLDTLREIDVLEFTMKDVCMRMLADGSFDAMIALHEF